MLRRHRRAHRLAWLALAIVLPSLFTLGLSLRGGAPDAPAPVLLAPPPDLLAPPPSLLAPPPSLLAPPQGAAP